MLFAVEFWVKVNKPWLIPGAHTDWYLGVVRYKFWVLYQNLINSLTENFTPKIFIFEYDYEYIRISKGHQYERWLELRSSTHQWHPAQEAESCLKSSSRLTFLYFVGFVGVRALGGPKSPEYQQVIVVSGDRGATIVWWRCRRTCRTSNNLVHNSPFFTAESNLLLLRTALTSICLSDFFFRKCM